jgi:hypothetical protein
MKRSHYFAKVFCYAVLLLANFPLVFTARKVQGYGSYNSIQDPYYYNNRFNSYESDYKYRQGNPSFSPGQNYVDYNSPYNKNNRYNGYGGQNVHEYNYPGGPDRQSLHFLGKGSTLVQTNGYDANNNYNNNAFNYGYQPERPYSDYNNKRYPSYDKNYYNKGYAHVNQDYNFYNNANFGGRRPTVIENNYPNTPGRTSVHYIGSGGSLIQNNGYDAPSYNQQQYYDRSRYGYFK